ncbi:MAG: DUF177 domain-containing protein [Clostridia bacterium]|nr:DUF177 domain-containing protein [Clostridia bacterium]
MRFLDINDFSRSDGERLPFDTQVDLSATEPSFREVRIVGALRNVVGVMTFRATVSGTCVAPCDRCLEDAVLSLESELKTVLTLESSDDDSVTVENGRIDLEKTAYDALVLALPTKILCREDCQGLCPSCGKNLNDGDCGCNQ